MAAAVVLTLLGDQWRPSTPTASLAGPPPAFHLDWGSGVRATNGLFNSPRGSPSARHRPGVRRRQHHNRMQVFTRDGTFVRKWGRLGTTNSPSSDRGDRGRLDGQRLPVDQGNHRVQKFTSTGTFVTAWGSLGSGSGQFRNPRGIGIDNRTLYVADTGRTDPGFSSTGAYIEVGTTGSGQRPVLDPVRGWPSGRTAYVTDPATTGCSASARRACSRPCTAAPGRPGQLEAPRGSSTTAPRSIPRDGHGQRPPPALRPERRLPRGETGGTGSATVSSPTPGPRHRRPRQRLRGRHAQPPGAALRGRCRRRSVRPGDLGVRPASSTSSANSAPTPRATSTATDSGQRPDREVRRRRRLRSPHHSRRHRRAGSPWAMTARSTGHATGVSRYRPGDGPRVLAG